mmetsp:Transcript_100478/g.174399  ORF Transcript_100478/g.174399 Transcript_100478/m.174399 type:complete len:254 (+) Transcript_100478:498-1259(+)
MVDVRLPRQLTNCRFSCKVSMKHQNMVASWFVRLGNRPEHVLVFLEFADRWHTGEVLRNCLSCHSHAITMQETTNKQLLHDHWQAAVVIYVRYMILTMGRHVCKDRHGFPNAVEIIDAEIFLRDVSLMRYRQYVQDAIRTATASIYHCDSVLQRLLGYNHSGIYLLCQEIDDSIGTGHTILLFWLSEAASVSPGHCWMGCGAGQRHAHGLYCESHGASCEHRSTTPTPRCCEALHPRQLLYIKQSRSQLRNDL